MLLPQSPDMERKCFMEGYMCQLTSLTYSCMQVPLGKFRHSHIGHGWPRVEHNRPSDIVLIDV